MNLSFDKLSFNQVTQLQAKYKLYFEAWSPPTQNRPSDAFTGTMFYVVFLGLGLGIKNKALFTRSHANIKEKRKSRRYI